jgi:hypothetical protein
MGSVPCQLFVSFMPGSSGAPANPNQCASIPGGAYVNAPGVSLDTGAYTITCELNQVPVPAGDTCVGGSTPGWCYVTGSGVSSGSPCTQQVSYSSNSVVPSGAIVSLVCDG